MIPLMFWLVTATLTRMGSGNEYNGMAFGEEFDPRVRTKLCERPEYGRKITFDIKIE